MVIRLLQLLMFLLFLPQFTLAEKIQVGDIKDKYQQATKPAEQEKLLQEIISNYTEVNLDSALYYTDVYKTKFLDSGQAIYNCHYYKLLGNIYKKQHNLSLYQEQAERALTCYTELNDQKQVAEAQLELGIASSYQGSVTDAISHFENAKTVFKELKDTMNAVQCAMHLGSTHIMQGDRANGLEHYFEVLEYYELKGYEEELGKLCNNIGLVYLDLVQNANALHYFQKALAYTEKTYNKFTTSQVLGNIARCHKENSEYNIALGYLTKGLHLSKEIKSSYSQANFYYEIAVTKNKLGKNYEALDAINSCLEIVYDINNVDQIARALVLKSKILLALSNYKQAHNACKECYEISKRTETLTIQRQALACISRTANALKIYREAYEYQREYIAINDSLQIISSQNKVASLLKESEYEKQKAILEQKNLLNEALLREEKTHTKIFAIFSLLSLLGLGLLAFIFMSNKKYTKRIKEQNKLINQSNKKLSDLNQDLAHANTKLNNFTSVAAHDLKSPIRTMASYSQLLMLRNKDKFEEKDKMMLSYVSNNASRLISMIDDLLSFSNTKEDLGPPETINIKDIVQYVKSDLTSKIAEQNATVEIIGELGQVEAHTNLLTQLFQNLISNGMKFRKSDVNPVIKVARVKEDASNITFSIEDNGMGIAKEFHEKIFTIFQRLHSADEIEGSGIGLSTCKNILDFYKQDIWLESEPGVGTKFFFTLPKSA